MAQENVGYIIEGLIKELNSGVSPRDVLKELSQYKALEQIFASHPRLRLSDALQEAELKKLLLGFLGDLKTELVSGETEEVFAQRLTTKEIVKQASEEKSAELAKSTLGGLKERRRQFTEDLVKRFTKFNPQTRDTLIKELDNLPVGASVEDAVGTIKEVAKEEPQTDVDLLGDLASKKFRQTADAASVVAGAVAEYDGPRPDIFTDIVSKKIEEQNPQSLDGYKKIIEEATPLARVGEAVTATKDTGGDRPYFQTFAPNVPSVKSYDENLKSSPNQHVEQAGILSDKLVKQALSDPELKKRLGAKYLASAEFAQLKKMGERGYTRPKVTAAKWLTSLFTTTIPEQDQKKVTQAVGSLLELHRLGIIPTSAFSPPSAPQKPGATLIETHTAWHPIILFYVIVAEVSPQELTFQPLGGVGGPAGQWAIGWAAQQGVEAGAARLAVQTGARGVGSKTLGTLLGGVFGGIPGLVVGWFGSDVIMRVGGGIWNRAKRLFGAGGSQKDLFGMEGALLPLLLVLAPIIFIIFTQTSTVATNTAFGVTSPYAPGAGGAAPGTAAGAGGLPTTSTNYTNLTNLGPFNQFNTTGVSGINTSRGTTRPLTGGEQAKISAAINAFPRFAGFAVPLGSTKINLTAFPAASTDDVIALAPPTLAGNIALYQNAFSFSDQTLGRLLAHELGHQIEWFHPDVYQAFMRGTTTVAKGYCGPLGTYIKSLPETSEETFAEAVAMYIIGDPRLKTACGGNTFAFMDRLFTKGI